MIDSIVLELLRKRRSIRQFADRPVETDKIEALIEAAVRTPASRARNPWDFIVVSDAVLLRQLGKAKQHGSTFLDGAPLAIVVAADPAKSDVWTEDCSIAAMVLQLVAEDLGLGSCWVQIRLRPHDARRSANQYLKELLELPDSYMVECILAIGYPAEKKNGHAFAQLPFAQVHRNKYGS
ncbi:MAG: nitroreductase family protein [Desulfuromonadales bacterium]